MRFPRNNKGYNTLAIQNVGGEVCETLEEFPDIRGILVKQLKVHSLLQMEWGCSGPSHRRDEL